MQLFRTTEGVARRRPDLPDVLDLLDVDELSLDAHLVGELPLDALAQAPVTSSIGLADASFLPCVDPRRVILIGLNYREHANEVSVDVPERLMFAAADPGSSVRGSGAIVSPPSEYSSMVDFEAELVIVIGAEADQIDERSAWQVISGITAGNDLTARDLQLEAFERLDFTTAKLLDGFKPLGPGVIVGDEIRGPHAIGSTVNGIVRQSASSDDMVFRIPTLVSTLSRELGLRPGDVIFTGSPAGVGTVTQQYLCDGDVIEVRVGGLPPLVTTIGVPSTAIPSTAIPSAAIPSAGVGPGGAS